jgi:hypothetical protein
MRGDSRSPGDSGHKRGLCLDLTTRDSLRQGHQGPQMPGLDVKVAEEQVAEPGRRRRPNLIHSDGITEKGFD